MDMNHDIREFLTTRRARLTPGEVGLPDYGGRRRVPGLRREEVALLAGMSVEYYVRFERGNAAGISETVLEGISRALQLDDVERRQLYDMVRAANAGSNCNRRRYVPRPQQVRPDLQQLLDAMTGVPALVQNGRMDIVATNTLGRCLFAEMYADSRQPANFARFLFLDQRSSAFYRDWAGSAHQIVAVLRTEAARVPHDRILSDLVGELTTGSAVFRTLWASHDVREHRTGVKRLRHPDVGELDLNYEAMELSPDRGLQFVAFTAKPGSVSHDSLQLLGSLDATRMHSPSPE